MTETLKKGKKYKISTDDTGDTCDVLSFQTHGDDVFFDDGTTATNLKTNVNDLNSRMGTLSSDLEDCFQSVSNGKELIASAITDMGITTSSDATFATMANNIKEIETVNEGETLAWFLASNALTPIEGQRISGFNYNDKCFSEGTNNTYICCKAGTYSFFAGGDMHGAPRLVVTDSTGTITEQLGFSSCRGVPYPIALDVGDIIYCYFTETPSSSGWKLTAILGAYI